MKFLFIALFFFATAFASDKSDAYNLICKSLTFESDRYSCQLILRNYSYFNNKALIICSESTFDSDKIACLKIIGDKMYEEYEISKCNDEIFQSQKHQCLNILGSAYNPKKCLPSPEVIEHVTDSLNDLRSGNISSTEQKLSKLLLKLNECQ